MQVRFNKVVGGAATSAVNAGRKVASGAPVQKFKGDLTNAAKHHGRKGAMKAGNVALKHLSRTAKDVARGRDLNESINRHGSAAVKDIHKITRSTVEAVGRETLKKSGVRDRDQEALFRRQKVKKD